MSHNNSYINTWHQAESKRCNRKICNKNCDGACTEWNCNTIGGDNWPVILSVMHHSQNPSDSRFTPFAANAIVASTIRRQLFQFRAHSLGSRYSHAQLEMTVWALLHSVWAGSLTLCHMVHCFVYPFLPPALWRWTEDAVCFCRLLARTVSSSLSLSLSQYNIHTAWKLLFFQITYCLKIWN
jgi:hypothetical protein